MEIQYRSNKVLLLLILSLALSLIALSGVVLSSIEIIEPEMEISFYSVSMSLGERPYSIKYVTGEDNHFTIELWDTRLENEEFMVSSCQMEAEGFTFGLSDLTQDDHGYDSWEFWVGNNPKLGRIGLPLPETPESVEAYITCSED